MYITGFVTENKAFIESEGYGLQTTVMWHRLQMQDVPSLLQATQ